VSDIIERLRNDVPIRDIGKMRMDALAEIERLNLQLARYELIAPLIETHLEEMEMDTPEDQAIVDALLVLWRSITNGP
jgi:hypothetical protein